MAHKFDPSNKDKLESPDRKKLYDLHELIKWFSISRGMVVADVGCGTGYCTIPVAAIVGEKGKVYACDISQEMLDVLDEKIQRWKVVNVETILAEENWIPVDDGSVDFILLALILHEMESPEDFFTEIKRILKKGGRIGIIDWDKVDSPHGPPYEERISIEEARKIVSDNGLVIDKDKMAGEYHYALLAGRAEDLRNEKIEKVGAILIKELMCLSEKEMRSFSLAERLKDVSPETVVDILQELCRKAIQKKAHYDEILENCLDMGKLRDAIGLENMSKIYLIAKERGYNAVVRILMNPPPKGKRYSEYDFVEGRETYDITLGEKRSLAKSFDRDTLDRLIYDEDPTVIKYLLANPRFTERDVLKVASKRPNKPEILQVIFKFQKWSSRYIVKRALVLNPDTPTGIALGLVNFMQYKDIKMIARDKSIHEEIRLSAMELLKNKFGE